MLQVQAKLKNEKARSDGLLAIFESIAQSRRHCVLPSRQRSISHRLIRVLVALATLPAAVLACSTHGTTVPDFVRVDPASGDIAIEDNLVPPSESAECVAGIGLGSPAIALPEGVEIAGLAIMITNTTDGTRRPFPPFSFSANAATTRALAAGSGSSASPGTNPLFPGSTWFGFSSQVDPFSLPGLGRGEIIELSFSVEVPEALLPLTIEVQFAAGEGLGDGTPSFTGRHPVQYFSAANTTVVLTTSGQSTHEITAVLDGAGFLPLVSPGAIVSVFGTFAQKTAEAESVPLSTNLDGLSIEFDGVPAPFFIVVRGDEFDPPLGFDQANVQVPWEVDISSGEVEVELEWEQSGGASVSSEEFKVDAAEASPGIFTFEFGPGPAIVQNVSLGDDDVVPGSFSQPAGSLPGLETQPAPIGGVITDWCNGLGPVTGSVATGDVPGLDAPLLETVKPIRLLIGGEEARIIGKPILHPTLVGLNQINAFVPAGVSPGDRVSIKLEVDCGAGKLLASRDDVFIAVRAAP